MKKKPFLIIVTIIVVALLIIIGFVVYNTRDIPIIQTPYTVKLADTELIYDSNGNLTGSQSNSGAFVQNQVIIMDVYFSNGEGHDTADYNIAAKFDPEKLVLLFAESVSKRSNIRAPFFESDMIWKIDLMQNNKPIHIVLGKYDYWYESSDSGIFQIVNGDAIEAELAGINQAT